MTETLKVGELARRSGITVRTLHHWDEIGLLRPSRHTAAGHRLYDQQDVARLHRIRSLRFLGFGLDEIARLLERPERHLAGLIRGRLADLDVQIELAQSLKSKLETFAQRLEAEQLLTLDEMALVEAFTGGDPGIAAAAGKLYQEEPGAQQKQGLDPALFAYIREAQAAAGRPS